MSLIRVGPNGEVFLPQTVMDRLGITPGSLLDIDVDDGEEVSTGAASAVHLRVASTDVGAPPLTAARGDGAQTIYSLKDFIGRGGRLDKPLTDEDIEETVRRRACERFFRE